MNELLNFLIDSLEDSQRKLKYIIDYVKSDEYIEIYSRKERDYPVSFALIGDLRRDIDTIITNIEHEKKSEVWEKRIRETIPCIPCRQD